MLYAFRFSGSRSITNGELNLTVCGPLELIRSMSRPVQLSSKLHSIPVTGALMAVSHFLLHAWIFNWSTRRWMITLRTDHWPLTRDAWAPWQFGMSSFQTGSASAAHRLIVLLAIYLCYRTVSAPGSRHYHFGARDNVYGLHSLRNFSWRHFIRQSKIV